MGKYDMKSTLYSLNLLAVTSEAHDFIVRKKKIDIETYTCMHKHDLDIISLTHKVLRA